MGIASQLRHTQVYRGKLAIFINYPAQQLRVCNISFRSRHESQLTTVQILTQWKAAALKIYTTSNVVSVITRQLDNFASMVPNMPGLEPSLPPGCEKEKKPILLNCNVNTSWKDHATPWSGDVKKYWRSTPTSHGQTLPSLRNTRRSIGSSIRLLQMLIGIMRLWIRMSMDLGMIPIK